MNKDAAETCMFFVDDSNIWIEAQKFAAVRDNHVPGLSDSDRDPRLRIDVGKLIRVILNGRSQGPSYLYGSRPPPNDSVWNVFKKSQFLTKIYDRSNGKEKEVDTAMSVDMSSEATEISVMAKFDCISRSKKAQTTFIAITGDRDMIPPVKKVLAYNIHVELWAWSSGISKDYYRLQAENEKLLTVKHLDWIFDNISFTNFRSTRQKNSESFKSVVLCNIIMLDGDDVESCVCEKLITLGRLFYTTQSETKTEMFVEFPMVTNMDIVVQEVRKLFKDQFMVMSWPEYSSRFQLDVPVTKTSNMYSPLDDITCSGALGVKSREKETTGTTVPDQSKDRLGEDEGRQDANNTDDSTGWTTVERSDTKSYYRRILRTQKCISGIRCKKAGSCGYQHTNTERNLFLTYSGSSINLVKWKTKECKKTFPHITKECPFAHSHDEAWCLVCQHEGHFTDSCRYRT
ncbi:hypothetical protein CMQ_5284 [Grosmannia clavigera kw1407]|uniref:NYN domain-containing protein n=1 Tax=Grosmannia clavigera (strain kw1407 / UAMH 11150) TaxID=655863 RepID=F0XBD2_GROCL|nr:uncharacterized protein CMQ_5284 [Grosmannia clavigera kw1407]EFX05022.1 hypothetical protein CMQ_5284 [Grosmannia clavigera kw1407]